MNYVWHIMCMCTSVIMYTHALSCNTGEAPQLYYGGCLLSMQSENEMEKAAEVENKSVLVCTSLSGCAYYLLTGGFKIVVFSL